VALDTFYLVENVSLGRRACRPLLWCDLHSSPKEREGCGAYLLLVLSNGPEVGLHLGTLGLQSDHLVDDDVGIGDFFEVSGRKYGELLGWLSINGMKGQLGGLNNTNNI